MTETLIPVYYPTPDFIADADMVPVTTDGTDLALDNDGNIIVQATNPTGDAITVTFCIAATFGGFALQNLEISLDPGASIWQGPFPPALFNRDDGTVLVTINAGGTLRGVGV